MKHVSAMMLLACLGGVLVQPTFADKPDIRLEDGRVFVTAEAVMLSEVLDELGAAAGIAVAVMPAADRNVTLSVRGRELRQALESIARQEQLNMVLGWRSDSGGKPVLVRVDVLPEGDADLSALEAQDQKLQRERLRDASRSKAKLKREERRREREERRKARTQSERGTP